jgi:type VI secretion system protein
VTGSLFERLTEGDAGAGLDEAESIRRHLQRMFTARQGSVQCLPDYGLPDINDLTLSRADLLKEICAGVAACVRLYEPRLTDVAVVPAPPGDSGFFLGLHITASRLDALGNALPWRWECVFDGARLRGRL